MRQLAGLVVKIFYFLCALSYATVQHLRSVWPGSEAGLGGRRDREAGSGGGTGHAPDSGSGKLVHGTVRYGTAPVGGVY